MAQMGQRWRDLAIDHTGARISARPTTADELLSEFDTAIDYVKLRINCRTMAPRSTPLGNYQVVRSSDPAFVRDRLFSVYGATKFDAGRQSESFAVVANHLQIGGLGLSYCDYASDVSIGFGEASFVRQFFAIDGVARFAAGRQSGEMISASWTPVLHARDPLKLDFKSGYRQFVLRIESDALSRNLTALIGQDIDRDLTFDPSPARQPAMEALRRRIFQFASDYNERGTSSPIWPQRRSNVWSS